MLCTRSFHNEAFSKDPPVVYFRKVIQHKCFAKVRRNWSASDSINHAYATFFFLSFTGLINAVSITLLTANIIIVSLFEQVLHNNAPPVQHFSPQHLPYVIIITTCISHVYLYLLLSYTIILHYIYTLV